MLNAPDILFDHLASIFRDWVVHGTVTATLLACAFLPLLKSSLKDPADTGSYRAIAGSNLILKLFEKTGLMIWGDLLSSDTLQFGFKKGTSTTQCSWLVKEVVGHYLREGSHPLVVVLDCSKAFDLCKFDKLFTAILDKGMPPVIVRVLMYIYEERGLLFDSPWAMVDPSPWAMGDRPPSTGGMGGGRVNVFSCIFQSQIAI